MTEEAPARRPSLAKEAGGWSRLIGPALVACLLALPLAWTLPLLRTELLWVLTNEVSVLGAVRSLAQSDVLLCAVVVLFGMVLPAAKLVALAFVWFALPAERARSWIVKLGALGKYAMFDVMLAAVVVVGLKGLGLGTVTVEYGVWAYAALVVATLLLTTWMQREAESAGRSTQEE